MTRQIRLGRSWWLTSAVVAAIFAWQWLSGPQSASDEPVEARQAFAATQRRAAGSLLRAELQIRQLQARQGQLESELGAVREQLVEDRDDAVGAQVSAVTGTTRDEDEATDVGEPTLEERVARTAEQLDGVFAEQSVDNRWSDVNEAAMAESLFASGLTGSSLVGALCKSTLCRAEVTHRDHSAFESFAEHIAQTPPWDNHGFIHRIDDGDEIYTVVFIAREGYELPISPRGPR